MDDPSARKYRLGGALCRLCSEKDETSWMPAQCLGFDGNSCDGNSFELKTHPQTGRPIRYGAGKGTFCARRARRPSLVPAREAKHVQGWGARASASTEVRQVQGVRGLEHLQLQEAATPVQGVRGLGHLRARTAKRVQGVRGLEHLRARRVRSQCRSGGSGICEHGRVRHRCKECRGSGICEHGAALLLQGVRGLGHLRAQEAAKQVQGLPRPTCCVFGNVFNTTGRYVSSLSRVRGRVHAPLRDAMEPKPQSYTQIRTPRP